MASDEPSTPWLQPKFLIAAVLVIALVVLGVVIAFSGRDEPREGSSTPTATSSATTPAPVDAGVESVCGLPGHTESGTLTTAPAAEWPFQGTTAYPTSLEFGPGATTPSGVRFCFQHTPTGALFAAANAIVQGSDPAVAGEWLEYALADGPYRDQILGDGESSGGSDSRMNIVGFRMLAYDGATARVDVAVRVTVETSTVFTSGVYELVWADGDWKLRADTAKPLNVARIPDLSGYVPWGA